MWDNAAITNAGAALLAQAVGENTLTISAAAAGTGTATDLQSLTSLSAQKQAMSIVGVEKSENNIKIQLQLTSIGNTQAYTLNQIGVWGSMGDQAALLAVYQNADGILMPTESDMPDFVFTFYANITVDNQTNISVTFDTSAIVSRATLENEINSLLQNIGQWEYCHIDQYVQQSDSDFDGQDYTLNGQLFYNDVLRAAHVEIKVSFTNSYTIDSGETVQFPYLIYPFNNYFPGSLNEQNITILPVCVFDENNKVYPGVIRMYTSGAASNFYQCYFGNRIENVKRIEFAGDFFCPYRVEDYT